MSQWLETAIDLWGRCIHQLNHLSLGMVLWLGFAAFSLGLLILIGTRWGQVKPVWKCVAFSLMAHVLLVGYAYGTRLIFTAPAVATGQPIELKLVEAEPSESAAPKNPSLEAAPWQRSETHPRQKPTVQPVARLAATPQPPIQRSANPVKPVAPPQARLPQNNQLATPPDQWVDASARDIVDSSAQPLGQQQIEPVQIEFRRKRRDSSDAFVAPQTESIARMKAADVQTSTAPDADRANRQPKNDTVSQLVKNLADVANRTVPDRVDAAPEMPEFQMTPSDPGLAWGAPSQLSDFHLANARRRLGDGKPLPAIYRSRDIDDRKQAAVRQGGSLSTEQAVNDALRWLSQHQEADGRWRGARFGAGQEHRVMGHDRNGAGSNADTGITSLSLLAFLAAGHSHFEGPYQKTVQRGLEFLLQSQAENGSLAGDARLFAQMYCHAMATLAISEALAMTGDQRLRQAAQRAVEYSLRAQNGVGGGWRYRPGDAGDMSQFGWQVLALKSAELGGIEIPSQTTALMQQFLARCSSGTASGLAGYRPGHPPTAAMTAEALLCRYFLHDNVGDRTAGEASRMILSQQPGNSEVNFYYWYYATLAMYHVGGDAWTAWNRSLTTTLLELQVSQGQHAGSWNPNGVWSGYGGRVYSTAMATLCLEVYYRYARPQ